MILVIIMIKIDRNIYGFGYSLNTIKRNGNIERYTQLLVRSTFILKIVKSNTFFFLLNTENQKKYFTFIRITF